MNIEPIYIGSVGAGLILLAFVMGQLHVWKDTYFMYDFVNLVGSLLLVWYGWVGEAWPFVALNGVWALVSFRDVVMDLSRNARKKDYLGSWDKWMR